MKVFIKKHPALDIGLVFDILRQDLPIQMVDCIDEIDTSDILIMSNKDVSISENEKRNYNIIFIEDAIDKINKNILQEIGDKYDYYYLRHQLSRAVNADINTIITGSSYGLFGINEYMLSSAVNLSLASQDLYYAIKGIEYIWKINTNIKHIIFCVSYYYFFSDLSKTNNDYEISRISKVYSPIFADRHNCYLLPPSNSILYKSDIFDIENILYRAVNNVYSKGYFNDNALRCNFATKIWHSNKVWSKLSYEEKVLAGKQRAISHNNNLKHINSLLENVALFSTFVKKCKLQRVSLTIVIPPVSKYYAKYIAPQFKQIFYEAINGMDSNLEILDYMADNSFIDEDFNDMDHLSESGAIKLTNAISKDLGAIKHILR